MHSYDCFASKVGGKGVKWHTRYPVYEPPTLPEESSHLESCKNEVNLSAST